MIKYHHHRESTQFKGDPIAPGKRKGDHVDMAKLLKWHLKTFSSFLYRFTTTPRNVLENNNHVVSQRILVLGLHTFSNKNIKSFDILTRFTLAVYYFGVYHHFLHKWISFYRWILSFIRKYITPSPCHSQRACPINRAPCLLTYSYEKLWNSWKPIRIFQVISQDRFAF